MVFVAVLLTGLIVVRSRGRALWISLRLKVCRIVSGAGRRCVFSLFCLLFSPFGLLSLIPVD